MTPREVAKLENIAARVMYSLQKSDGHPPRTAERIYLIMRKRWGELPFTAQDLRDTVGDDGRFAHSVIADMVRLGVAEKHDKVGGLTRWKLM